MAYTKETVVIEAKVEGEKDVENLGKAINDNKKATESLEKSTSQLSGSIDKMAGGAVTGFKSFLGGVKNVATGFKTLRGAIIATGLGALFVVIGSIVAALEGSEEGQNKWNKVLSITGVIVGNIIDLFADFGDMVISAFENPRKAWDKFVDGLNRGWQFIQTVVIKPFIARFSNLGLKFDANIKRMRIAWNEFTGDDEEAKKLTKELDKVNDKILENEEVIKKGEKAKIEFYSGAKKAVQGFLDEQKKETKSAGEVADMRAKADKIERNLLVRRAELENKIAQLRLKSRQEEEFSAEERKQALLDAQDLEDELLQKETEALKLRSEAQSLENSFARSNKDNLDEEASLKAAVIQQEAKRTNAARSTQRQLNRINKEIQRDNQAIQKEEEAKILEFEKFKQDLEKMEQDRLAQTELEKIELEQERKEAELERLEITETQKQELLLEIERFYGEKKATLQEKQNKEEEERDKKLKAKKAEIKEKELQADRNRNKELQGLITDGLGAVAESAGLGKEFSIAKTLFDTYQSARAAFSSQLIPGDPSSLPRAIGAAAFSAVSGLADVAAIRATKVPQVPGGGGAGSGGASQPQPPTPPSFNLVGASGSSAITQPLIDNEQQPVEAFVVSKNVTTAQQLDSNAVSQSTF